MGFHYEVKGMVESLGVKGAQQTIKNMLEKKEIAPGDFSLKELKEACTTAKLRGADLQEAVSSDLFPTIMGQVISQKIVDSYQIAATIGDELTTTVPSKLKTENIPGFTATKAVGEVLEGQPYNDSQFEEKYSTLF